MTDKIKQIAIMGDDFKGGNIIPRPYINFYNDRYAAHVVINSGTPIISAGLDMTEQVLLHEDDLKEIESAVPTLGA